MAFCLFVPGCVSTLQPGESSLNPARAHRDSFLLTSAMFLYSPTGVPSSGVHRPFYQQTGDNILPLQDLSSIIVSRFNFPARQQLVEFPCPADIIGPNLKVNNVCHGLIGRISRHENFTSGKNPPTKRKGKSRLALKKHTLLLTKKYYSRIGDAFASKGFVRMAREKKWG